MNQIPFGQILSSNNIVWYDDNGNQVGTEQVLLFHQQLQQLIPLLLLNV